MRPSTRRPSWGALSWPPVTGWPRSRGCWRYRIPPRWSGPPLLPPPAWARSRSPTHQGLHVHTTLALTPERLPLGLLAQQVWARDPAAVGKRTTRKHRPLADTASQQWRTRVAAVHEAPARCAQTRFVGVGDRAADVYDLCLQDRPAGVDRLVRAAWNRRVDHPARSLWTQVAAPPVVATLTVRVPRRGPQPARQATVAVRWCLVRRWPPTPRSSRATALTAVWVVQAVEEPPPASGEPPEWVLLTTCAVHTMAEAVERVDWYACRWGIAVWHQGLKRGGRLEARHLETADRLRRGLAVYSVLAGRRLSTTMVSRAMPDAPCTALLEPEAWQALSCAIPMTPTPPSDAAPAAAGRVLDWPPGRIPGPPWRWSTRGDRVVERVSTFTALTLMDRIMHPAFPTTKHMWVKLSPGGEGRGEGSPTPGAEPRDLVGHGLPPIPPFIKILLAKSWGRRACIHTLRLRPQRRKAASARGGCPPTRRPRAPDASPSPGGGAAEGSAPAR